MPSSVKLGRDCVVQAERQGYGWVFVKEGATRQILRDWLASRTLEEADLFGTLAIMPCRSEKLAIVLTDVALGGT